MDNVKRSVREEYVQSDGARFWTATQGQGEVLVLLHGGPGASDQLQAVADMVATLFRCIATNSAAAGDRRAVRRTRLNAGLMISKGCGIIGSIPSGLSMVIPSVRNLRSPMPLLSPHGYARSSTCRVCPPF